MLHGLALLLGVGFPLGAMAAAAGPIAPQAFTAKVTEWQLPKPMFARSSAVAPDGSLYIALPNDNKIVRFDPRTQAFNEWDLLGGHHPNSVLVDHDGTVWTAGYGNGTIGRLKPATGMIAEFSVPSGGGGPHTLALSKDGTTLWFTLQTGDKIGSVDVATGRIAEYETSGSPSGIALDRAGNVWWCRSSEHKLGRLEPLTGRISELDLGRGSRPRRIATAPDGMLWVTLYGKGQLARVDPVAMKVVKTQALPGGNAGAYSVAVDDAGIVWANEIKLDAVVRFDPATESMRTIKLPSLNVGIRKLTIDGAGRVWYTGSHNGRLGVIE
jgi:virginiamycin B lyase